MLDNARALFAQHGYFATTVNEIAEASRVSAGTIYQQCGGKHGLLHTLMDTWTTSSLVQQTLDQINAATSVDSALGMLDDAYLEFWRQFDDIAQVVVHTAAQDAVASQHLQPAFLRHRTALAEIARRMRALGEVSYPLNDDDFIAIALYHYGPQNGYHLMISDMGWPEGRAKDFISTQFARTYFTMTATRLG